MVIDVMELNFQKLNFIRSYENSRRLRGRAIYYSEMARVTKVEKIDEKNYIISAKVEGSHDNEYDVTLKINDTYIRECSCTCDDFYNGNICKHIIATSMETIEPNQPSTEAYRKKLEEKERKEREEALRLYQERLEKERKEREYRAKYASALDTIRTFKNDPKLDKYEADFIDEHVTLREIYNQAKEERESEESTKVELTTNISLEPKIELKDNESINLTFKIGGAKKYILKDIEEFWQAIEEGKTLQYGKGLRFVASRENFEEKSKKLLEYILEYGKIASYNQRMIKDRYYYGVRSVAKDICVFENQLDDFFEITKDLPIIVSGYRINKEEYKTVEDELDIRLDVNKLDEEYELKINIEDYDFVSSNKNIYVFYNKKIYKIEKNEQLEGILNLFKYNKEMLIPNDKLNEFEKYVFPKVREYLQTENLPAEVVEEVKFTDKLASKIYLDLDEKDNITLELKFCYSNYEFNILDEDSENLEGIVRDKIKEAEVLKRIFLDGFELVNNKKCFVLKNQDWTYEFLIEKIEKYMNDFEVLVTDRFKNKKVTNTRLSNVSIKLDNGLLELDISKLNIDIDEVQDVLKNYTIKKKYYKLKNGDYLSLEQNEDLDFLSDIQNGLDINFGKLDESGVIKMPINRSIYLEKLLEQNRNVNANRNDSFTKLINNVENKNFSEQFEIPKGFEDVLRDYQKTGYKWLKVLEYYGFGGILADDMGLGKTLQIITLIVSSLESKNTAPSIVVCPSSLVLNWKAEIEKWCPEIKVLIISGDMQTRKEQVSSCSGYNLVITSYDLLKRDIEEYEGKKFKYIIADEAQYIKNFATQNATALKNLEGETRFALTGTPIENSVSELWSIFDFIMPGYLYNYNKFRNRLEIPILKENNEEAMKKLKLLISPFVLRRVKKDVLTELPDKNITIMNNEMTDEQAKIYLSYFAQTKKEVTKELSNNGFEKSKFKILMLLTRLRQICCHPSLFIENYKGQSGKLNQCMDLVLDAIDSGHKILLFSGYTSMFKIIEEKLNKEGIKYYKLTGSTQVSKRVEMVEQFNKNKDVKVFLISLKAGGTGLNLTGADVVIHYDPWWNVSSENQATDRAYRIGQKNSVQVYKLITTNSIEEKINKLQEKKSKISEQLLSTEEKFINKFSKEEIMELFE